MTAAYTVRRWWFRVVVLLMVSPFIVGLWSVLR